MAFNECNPRKQGLEPEMQEVHAGENNAGMGQAPFLWQKRQSFEGSNEKKKKLVSQNRRDELDTRNALSEHQRGATGIKEHIPTYHTESDMW